MTPATGQGGTQTGASTAEEGALDSVAGTSLSVLGCRKPGMTAPQASETPYSPSIDTILITGLCSYHLGRQTKTVVVHC